jgi:hypothetical protein
MNPKTTTTSASNDMSILHIYIISSILVECTTAPNQVMPGYLLQHQSRELFYSTKIPNLCDHHRSSSTTL